MSPSGQSADNVIFFQEVTKKICGTLRLDLALARCFTYLKGVLPLDELWLIVVAPDLCAIKKVAVADHSGAQAMLDAPQILPISAKAMAELTGNALPNLRVLASLRDERTVAEISELLPDTPNSSLVILRLILDDTRQGAVVFRADGTNRYTPDVANLIAQLNEPFALALNNAMTHHEVNRLKDLLVEDNRFLHGELRRLSREEIVGSDFGLASVMDLVAHVALRDNPVLLVGETGVGKEVIAHAIHASSRRSDGPLVTVNCGAIPSTLIDSELFGHEKGAFTGAVAQKRGRFERAHRGTLFLDEIGELPRDVQVRLLRVLQSGEFERVGGTTPIQSDVRVIAATHRDLARLVREGIFREDLWYRINVFPIEIPPLRRRKGDIPALVHHFIDKWSRRTGQYPPPAVAPGAMEQLMRYDWPGNVRELENVVERALILSRGRWLSFTDVGGGHLAPASVFAERPAAKPPVRLDEAIAAHLARALDYTGGKVSGPGGAAELLGINPSTLRNRMKRLGISARRRRGG